MNVVNGASESLPLEPTLPDAEVTDRVWREIMGNRWPTTLLKVET